jgi:hypothetical protein
LGAAVNQAIMNDICAGIITFSHLKVVIYLKFYFRYNVMLLCAGILTSSHLKIVIYLKFMLLHVNNY